MHYLETFILIIEAVGSLMVIIGGLWAVFKFLEAQKKQDAEIEKVKHENETEIQHIKEEQQVIAFSMLACLDGLKQLGANGEVTNAHRKLSEHLNLAAHRE